MNRKSSSLAGRALVGAGLALMLVFAPAQAQEPCRDCPPASELVAQWRQAAARVTASLAEQLARGVLAVDVAGWVERAAAIETALSRPDTLAVFVTRGAGQQIVAVNNQDYDLVWHVRNGRDLVAVDDSDYDLVFSERSGREMLAVSDQDYDLVAIDAGGGDPLAVGDSGWSLLAMTVLAPDQLKIDDHDWDLVAVDGKDYDLVAVVGAGEGLGNSAANAWNSVANAGEAQAWHEYNVAFDTWLPVR